MRRKRLKKSHTPVDKSKLKFGLPEKIDDPEYLASYNGSACVASDNGIDLCGSPAVGCHIRAYENGKTCGGGEKPNDDLTESLCASHHTEQAQDEKWFWIERVYKPQRRRAYQRWKRSLND